uniref:hypothetical protein n=1 Tax=Akkermansia muciniphila TaxID=239935 RepID=UPI003FD8A6EE
MIFLSFCPSLFSSAASTQLSPLLPRNKKAAPHGAAFLLRGRRGESCVAAEYQSNNGPNERTIMNMR